MKSKRYKNEATATKSEHDRNVRLHVESWAYDIWEVEVCHHGEQIARWLQVEREFLGQSRRTLEKRSSLALLRLRGGDAGQR